MLQATSTGCLHKAAVRSSSKALEKYKVLVATQPPRPMKMRKKSQYHLVMIVAVPGTPHGMS